MGPRTTTDGRFQVTTVTFRPPALVTRRQTWTAGFVAGAPISLFAESQPKNEWHLPSVFVYSGFDDYSRVILMVTSEGSASPASTSMALMIPTGTGQAAWAQYLAAASWVRGVAAEGDLLEGVDFGQLGSHLLDGLAAALDRDLADLAFEGRFDGGKETTITGLYFSLAMLYSPIMKSNKRVDLPIVHLIYRNRTEVIFGLRRAAPKAMRTYSVASIAILPSNLVAFVA